MPIRKQGKLPAATHMIEYDLEYGSNKLEIHRDTFVPGARSGDRRSAGDRRNSRGGLPAGQQAGGVIEEVAFLIELEFLHGRDKLGNYPVFSLIRY